MIWKLSGFFCVFLFVAGCASKGVQAWSDPYTKKNTIDEILELRGQPFDVVREGDLTRLEFYAGFTKSNGWTWVPYVNMVAAGLTTWITKETVTVDSNGYYVSANGEVRKDFDQMFVGLGKELAATSKDFEEEKERVKKWYESMDLEFAEEYWTGVRGWRRTWDGM